MKPYQTNQQSNVNKPKTGGYMKRDGDKLLLNGRPLSDNEVKELVGEANYNTYKGAQKTFMPKMNSKLLVKVSNLIIVKTMEFVVNTSIMTGMALVGVQ